MDTGATIGVFGVVLAVVFYFRRGLRAALAYRIVENRPLLTQGVLDTRAIQVMADGKEIEDPWVWAVEIVNVGSTPIRPPDFQGPLFFEFSEGDRLLQFQAVGDTKLWHQRSDDATRPWIRVGFEPQVINRGDHLTIAALTDGRLKPGPPVGKIAGVSEIQLVKDYISDRTLISPHWEAVFLLLIASLTAAVLIRAMLP